MAEIIPSSLDIFSKTGNLWSISEYRYEKIHTKTPLDDSVKIISVSVPADTEWYTSLYHSYVVIVCRYLLGNSTKITEDMKIGPINNLGSSIFSNITQTLNDVRVSALDNGTSYINYIHNWAQSKPAQDGAMTLGLFYNDSYASYDACNQADPQVKDVAGNPGLTKRAEFFSKSKSVILISAIPSLPLHNCQRLFPPGIKFNYQFELQPMDFFSQSLEEEKAFKFQITDFYMMIRREKVSPSLRIAQAKMLTNHNAIYPTKYLLSRSMGLQNGQFHFNFDSVFTGELPVSIFVFFVSSISMSPGSLTQNPFCFRHLNISSLVAKIGMKKVPAIEMKLNMANRQSQMAFFSTLNALNYMNSPLGGPGGFNRESIEKGNFVWALDLSRDGNPSGDYNNMNFEATNLSLEGQFRTPVDPGYTGKIDILLLCIFLKILLMEKFFLVYVIGLFKGRMELNRFLTPITSWG